MASSAMNMSSPDVCFTPPNQALMGPVGILWDMENCPIPVDVNTDEVAGNIRMALRVHPTLHGSVSIFSAYGDFNQFPRRLREGCQRTGINLIDVPNGRKDAADKAILVDMFLFALDNPPPCTILLISGDVDFAPALHKLGQRGYTVLLVVPAAQAVASALCNAGRYVWDWPSVARGEGFVPAKALRGCTKGGNFPDYANASGGQSSDDSDHVMEDEPCVRGRYGKKLVDGIARDNQHQNHGVGYSPSLEKKVPSPYQHYESFEPAAHIPACILTRTRHTHFADTGTGEDNYDKLWAQPGDIEGLKNQLIKLLKLNGGMLDFKKVSGDYKKMYGRPLFLSDYGSPKLADLFKRMGDAFEVVTTGSKKVLCLLERIPELLNVQANKSVCRKDAGVQKVFLQRTKGDDVDLVKEVILLRTKGEDALAYDQRIKGHEALPIPDDTTFQGRIEIFKRELQELLVSYSCRLLLDSFRKVYLQRYSHDLDLDTLGVTEFDELLEKVQDVVVVKEEPGTKRKFLIARHIVRAEVA